MNKREARVAEYFEKQAERYEREIENLNLKIEELVKERCRSEDLDKLCEFYKTELEKKDEEINRIIRDNDEANRAREIWEELGKIGHRVEELLKVVNKEFPGELPIGI